MKIEQWNIERVIPYARNPRKNDQAVACVKASIKEFGFQQPLVVDKDGVLVVGHTRLKAAQELGLTKVPVTIADNLTPQQVKAYRILDNKTNEKAGWDLDLLTPELEEIKELSEVILAFGEGELHNLLHHEWRPENYRDEDLGGTGKQDVEGITLVLKFKEGDGEILRRFLEDNKDEGVSLEKGLLKYLGLV